MPLLTPNEPLGLPKGSVRAVLTLILVGSMIYATLQGITNELLSGFTGMALTYYFKTRVDETKNNA